MQIMIVLDGMGYILCNSFLMFDDNSICLQFGKVISIDIYISWTIQGIIYLVSKLVYDIVYLYTNQKVLVGSYLSFDVLWLTFNCV